MSDIWKLDTDEQLEPDKELEELKQVWRQANHTKLVFPCSPDGERLVGPPEELYLRTPEGHFPVNVATAELYLEPILEDEWVTEAYLRDLVNQMVAGQPILQPAI